MAVEVRWLIEPRVLLQDFTGPIRLEDATQALLAGPPLIATGTPPVHMVVNLLGVTQYPRSVYQLQGAIRNHPYLDRIGWLAVIVRHNPLLIFTVTILTRVRFANLRVAVVDDMAGALRLLRERDSSLEALISAEGEPFITEA
ncbi:MAG TPA: hypothetical protein VER79_11120 [Candidatus Limnocylindrales bacterium]|nr:hypothetical protein [Candidatus Limnocylindrales bacterium]